MATANLKAKLSLDDSPFTASLRRAVHSASTASAKMAGSLSKVGLSMSGLATGPLATLGVAIAGAFSAGALAAGVKGVFDATESLGDLSDQTGISVGRLAVLSKAFENAGFDGEAVGTSINKMQAALVGMQGAGGEGALTKLGLTLKGLKGMRPEQQFIALGSAISKITDPAERTAASMEIFGKAGGRLNAVFNDPAFTGAGGELTGKAAILEANAEIFTQASLKLNRAGNILKGFYVGIASGVAGPLVGVLDQLNKINLVEIGQRFGKAIGVGASALSTAMKDVDAAQLEKLSTAFAINMGVAAGFIGKDLINSANSFNAIIKSTMREVSGLTGVDPDEPPTAPANAPSQAPVEVTGSDSMFGPDKPRFKSPGMQFGAMISSSRWNMVNGVRQYGEPDQLKAIVRPPSFEQRGGKIFKETAGGALENPRDRPKDSAPGGPLEERWRGGGLPVGALSPMAPFAGALKGLNLEDLISSNPNKGGPSTPVGGFGPASFTPDAIEEKLDAIHAILKQWGATFD